MELTSLYFMVFVLFACIVYYNVPSKMQWAVLLAASLAFFVMSSGILTIFMLVTSALVYAGGLWLDKHSQKFEADKKLLDKSQRKEAKKKLKKSQKIRVAVVSVAVLGILIVLKYRNLGIEIINLFGADFGMFSIVLPLGISYYTLMAVSYVTDVYRGKIRAEKNPLRVLLFVCYFPHITEGPFDRYKELNDQFSNDNRFDYDSFVKGFILVIYGLFKKLVIADRIGLTVSEVFNNISDLPGSSIPFVTVLYTIQLYCDFSGCIDIVSGVSEMFGIKLAENFRQPFFSQSINEFWRRWHISLGLWLKEYVYYPVILSGHFKRIDKLAKKHIKSNHLVNVIPAAYALFFVWFSNGFWHGASIKYILYGLYYYFLMMLGELCKPLFEKTKSKLRITDGSKPFSVFRMLRTFVIVNIGMLLFKSETVEQFIWFIKRSLTNANLYSGFMGVYYTAAATASIHWIALIGITAVFVLSVIAELKPEKTVGTLIYSLPFPVRYLLITGTVLVIVFFGIYGPGYSASDFVYAQF